MYQLQKMEKIDKIIKKKQPKFTKPTVALKHKKVLDNLATNGGNIGQAIRDTGLYSEEMARNPTKITNSVTWKELMEHYINDDELAEKHKALLNASTLTKMTFDEEVEDEEIREYFNGMVGYKLFRIVVKENEKGEVTSKIAYYRAPDTLIQEKALDKAYKLKGRYVDDTLPQTGRGATYNFIFSQPVQEKIKAIEAEIKGMLTEKPNDIQTD